jgi:hypothetical protein
MGIVESSESSGVTTKCDPLDVRPAVASAHTFLNEAL